jgi:hypothetical protein
MTPFVTTKTTRAINSTVDGFCPGGALMSVVTRGGRFAQVGLTIGARYRHAESGHFSKDTLKDLIGILQEIHDAMGVSDNV